MEKYFKFLEELRDSGVTNMWGAAPYLSRAFDELDCYKAREVLLAWMDSKYK